ncbi:MAG: exodeoxyribonuclease III [Anaerolineales bacterium]
MQITTWNVNGLRSLFRKKADRWWREEQPDVLCLQEIRARPEQLTTKQRETFNNMHSVWHSGGRPGYSGVATFSQNEPVESVKGIGEGKFDWEGRLIQTIFPDFHLFNVYVPNGGRDLSRLDYKLEFYALLLSRCDQLHAKGEKVVICGDINTAHQAIDLRNPKENESNTGFLPEERAWIDRFLASGFIDVYRETHPDREAYTWWTYRFNARKRDIGWRLDYFLISESLMPEVKDVLIHTNVMGSDHCPVSLFLRE